MVYSRKKLLTMKCAKCFKEKDTLAWFVSKNSMYNETALCRICFKEQFNKLSEQERKEWSFYDNKKDNNS